MNLKLTLPAISLTMGLLASLPNLAEASVNRDAIRTGDDSFVFDHSKHCVRSASDAAFDPCEGEDIYTKIMQMDERKVYFDFDKALLKDSEKNKLRVVANILLQHNITAVKIVGYTDKIGTDDYNQRLSFARANAVRTYLTSLIQLDSSIIDIRGLGKMDQVKECENTAERNELISCLAPNRRVEIEVDYYDIYKEQKAE